MSKAGRGIFFKNLVLVLNGKWNYTFFLKAGQVHHHWSEHLDETIVGLYDASVGYQWDECA